MRDAQSFGVGRKERGKTFQILGILYQILGMSGEDLLGISERSFTEDEVIKSLAVLDVDNHIDVASLFCNT